MKNPIGWLPGIVRRRWRKLSNILDRRSVELVYGPGYALTLNTGLHDPRRGERILAYLEGQDLVRPSHIHEPDPVPLQLLRQIHHEDYLDALHDPASLSRAVGFQPSDGEHNALMATQRLMAGGTLLATRLVAVSGGIAVNLGGGLHHAFPDRAERFCVFHDVAAAVADQRQRGFDGRILIVDLDLHDGDATREHFAADDTVHTFSIHNQTNGDGEAVASTAIELGAGIEDERFLAVLDESLPPLFEAFRPELVLYIAGTDPAEDDKLGDWSLSAEGLLARDRRVYELSRPRRSPEPADGEPKGETRFAKRPLVIVLGGGYGSDAWRHTARTLAWMLTGDALEPPTTEALTLAGYRRLAAHFRPAELTGEDPDDWGLSEEDILGALGSPRRRSERFLGYYSQHGIELALERAGLFDRLRALGYRQPVLDFDLSGADGETMRVFGSPRRRHLLMELKVRRDKASLPPHEMLRVEWLLLQNPRREFSDRQPRLPGQQHPGLGMLRDLIALLVLVCDRQQLDGLLFVPSHYHTASQSRRVLRFVHPQDEGRFRALRSALGGLPLAQATGAVDEGRVQNLDTGEPFRWQPVPMVLPISDELESRMHGDTYEEEAEAVRGNTRLELRPATAG
ncbi:MAG: histone deacetylase [Acidobacteriota bacterium]